MESNQGVVTVVGKKENRIVVAGLVIHVANARNLIVCHLKGTGIEIALELMSTKFAENLVGFELR